MIFEILTADFCRLLLLFFLHGLPFVLFFILLPFLLFHLLLFRFLLLLFIPLLLLLFISLFSSFITIMACFTSIRPFTNCADEFLSFYDRLRPFTSSHFATHPVSAGCRWSKCRSVNVFQWCRKQRIVFEISIVPTPTFLIYSLFFYLLHLFLFILISEFFFIINLLILIYLHSL